MQLSYRTVCLLAYYGDRDAKSFIDNWKLRNPSKLHWEWNIDTYEDNPLGTILVSNMPQRKA